MKKTVLVTGGGGFLGRHLCQALANEYKVIALVRNVAACFGGESVDYDRCQGDITDVSRIEELLVQNEIKFVFHLAARSIVRDCDMDPLGAFQTNGIGTASVLEAVRRIGGVEGVFVLESDKSYGSVPDKFLPYCEDGPVNPERIYEVSKFITGAIARSYSITFDIPLVCLRPANLFGPGDMNLSRLVPGSIIRALNGDSPLLYEGVQDYVREFLYVDDLVWVLRQMLREVSVFRGETFNVGSSNILTIGDVVRLVSEEVGTDVSPKIVSKAKDFVEIDRQFVDYEKLKALLPDYRPTEFSKGLEATVSWYRSRRRFF